MRTQLTSILLVSVAAAQSSAPPKFEVASIKASQPQPDGQVRVGGSMDPGRISLTFVSFRDLLVRAYEVKAAQINGPAWIDTERYDLTATFQEGMREQLPAMLRCLMEERFQLKLHRENKEMPVYELVQGKSGVKLNKAAQPDGRTGVRMEGYGDGIMHANIASATMSNFSDMVGRWTDRPVIDKTGLTDKFDITLDLSMEDLQRSRSANVIVRGPGGGPPSSGPAPEGNPAGSLFTSIQKLGLKLEPKRAALDLLVVDKAEKVPLEN